MKKIADLFRNFMVHTSGDWKYIRIGGGLTVAWASVTVTVAQTVSSAAFGGYRSADTDISIPSGIFDETPYYVLQNKRSGNSMNVVWMSANSPTLLRFITGSGEKITGDIVLSVLAIGGGVRTNLASAFTFRKVVEA